MPDNEYETRKKILPCTQYSCRSGWQSLSRTLSLSISALVPGIQPFDFFQSIYRYYLLEIQSSGLSRAVFFLYHILPLTYIFHSFSRDQMTIYWNLISILIKFQYIEPSKFVCLPIIDTFFSSSHFYLSWISARTLRNLWDSTSHNLSVQTNRGRSVLASWFAGFCIPLRLETTFMYFMYSKLSRLYSMYGSARFAISVFGK